MRSVLSNRTVRKTNLWTNPSDNGTSSQDITLSQSYQNFDFVEVKYKYPNQTESLKTTKHIWIYPEELYNSRDTANSALVGLCNRSSVQVNPGGVLIGYDNWSKIRYNMISGGINVKEINGITL